MQSDHEAVTHRSPGTHDGARRLLSGALVDVAEWHCIGQDVCCVPTVQSTKSFDVVVTRRGAFSRESGGHTVLSHAGVVTFWHPDERYHIEHPVPGGDVCSVFRLPEDGVRELIAAYAPHTADAATVRFPVPDFSLDGAGYLVHRMAVRTAATVECAASPMSLAAEEQAMAFLHHAVARAVQRSAGIAPTGRLHAERRNRYAAEYARRVHEVIARRFREPLTLRDIARAVACSPYHLSRIVTAHDGVPIYRLVLQLRLRESLERVLDSRESLSIVALDAGFSSQSHFGEAFRREFGMSPGVLRRGGYRPTIDASVRIP
jgi:AraC-like DNA-binding protein